MADTNTTRRVDPLEFLDNDPFAELTRIMGHDPRVAAAAPEQAAEPAGQEPAAAPALAYEDDLDIELDLEKELMGDLDFEGFDAPPQDEAAAPFRHEPEDWRADPAAEAHQDVPAAWDLDRRDDVEEPASASVFAEPHGTPEPAEEVDLDFGFDLSEELAAEVNELPEEAQAPAAAPVIAETTWDDWSQAADVHDVAETQIDDEDVFVEAAYPPEALLGGAAIEEMPLDGAGGEEPVAAFEGEPLFLDVPDAQEASHEPAVEAEPIAAEDTPFVAASQDAEALSLEDELNALLAGDPAPGAAPAFEPEPVFEASPAEAVEQEAWRPTVDTFGRANLTAPQHHAFEPEPPAEAEAPQDDDLADMFGAMELDLEFEPEPAAPLQPEPVAAAAEWVPPPVEEPAMAPARPAGVATPDVETVEISDAAFAVEDDLDIPDIDYGTTTPARAYDDLESQFADAFGELAFDEPDPAERHPLAAAPAAVAAPAAAASPSYAAAGADEWQLRQEEFEQDDFDYERDLEQAVAMSTYEGDDAEPEPRRRGLLIAAFVAAVAVIGGAGVFGMSFFGDDADGPVLVRADSDPMKVKPENPGGTTVPNQNNEVYQRVQGGESAAAPQQESLITTAEEPLDVAAAEEIPPLPSGISDEADEPAAAQQQKSEDRFEPASEDAVLGALEETPVVTPRRVRTMVVRPDGTLVPREEIEPAAAEPQPLAPLAAAEAQPAPEGTATAAAPESLAPEAAAQVPLIEQAETLAVEDEGPVVETPQTVAVVPTRRTEPQAAAPAAPAAQPAVQAPAATPVSAPAATAPAAAAAADGAWSMQIASQPTAESAQASYQDLARRYGSVLQGRGVNIVRADIEGMGTYYRVRIPAASRDEAVQLCTRYKSAGGSCFVSR